MLPLMPWKPGAFNNCGSVPPKSGSFLFKSFLCFTFGQNAEGFEVFLFEFWNLWVLQQPQFVVPLIIKVKKYFQVKANILTHRSTNSGFLENTPKSEKDTHRNKIKFRALQAQKYQKMFFSNALMLKGSVEITSGQCRMRCPCKQWQGV